MIAWWVDKYNLPPNHPLLLERTETSLFEEYLRDLYRQKSALEHQLDKSIGDRDSVLSSLNVIRRSLGENEAHWDPLVAEWDAALERGELPDLEAKMPHGG